MISTGPAAVPRRTGRAGSGAVDKIIRRRALLDGLHELLWLRPSIAVVAAFAVGMGLSQVRVQGTGPGGLLFAGDAEAARGILQLVIGTTLTVTATVFSIMVVALQLASTQFSPRSLRSYVRDAGTQRALAVLMAVVAYAIAVLLATGDGSSDAPTLAVTVAAVALLPVMAALVYFIHHIAQSIRIEQLMQAITDDTLAALERNHPDPHGDEDAAVGTMPAQPPAHAVGIPARTSGYLQQVDAAALADVARADDLTVLLRPLVGEHCVEGVPVAWAWHADGREVDPSTHERLTPAVAEALQIGFERTLEQDVGFGLRQLVDISLRAVSPGINDPRTAIEATKQLTQVLCRLAGRELRPQAVCDADGQVRAFVPRPSFTGYLALACDELRRFGAREPTVMTAQLTLLEQVALSTRAADRRAAIADQVERILAAAERETADRADLAQVHRQAEAVQDALSDEAPRRVSAPVR